MASGGYDIGASFSSSSPSASSLNSPFNVQGGGGSFQLFAANAQASGVNQPSSPKFILYAGIVVVALGALALVFLLFRK